MTMPKSGQSASQSNQINCSSNSGKRSHQRKFRRREHKNSNSSSGTAYGNESLSTSSNTNPLVANNYASSESVSSDNSGVVLERVMSTYGVTMESDDDERRWVLDRIEKLLVRWSMTLRSLDNGNNYSNNINSNKATMSSAAAAVSSSTTGAASSSKSTLITNPWQRPRVALVTFGSYRLGAHRRDSDLDLLALSPPNCSRHDFFTSLVALLKEDPYISDVHPIPQAYTPVIKFAIRSNHKNSTVIQVDLVFARLADPKKLLEFQTKRVSPLVYNAAASDSPRLEYIISDVDLIGLDEPGMRSLNGARVSQILLQMVPNLRHYRTVLRAVKEWATRVGIYSNVLGFLGGVNWAILVAWVCIRHPLADCDTLFQTFFQTFAQWDWRTPVLLTHIQDTPPVGAVQLPAWNPQVNPRDGLHIMPIITPAYPSMNSAYNVGMPQRRRIHHEMVRACNLLQHGDAEDRFKKVIFQRSDFFIRHHHFLQVTIRASDRQDFVEWFRLVESRLRLLICSLETTQVHAWPFARFFDVKSNKKHMTKEETTTQPSASQTNEISSTAVASNEQQQEEQATCFFIGLRFSMEIDEMNLRYLTLDFLHKVNSWEGRKMGMDLRMDHVTSDNLPDFIFQEDEYPPLPPGMPNGKAKKNSNNKSHKNNKNYNNSKENLNRDNDNCCFADDPLSLAETRSSSGESCEGGDSTIIIPGLGSPTKKYRMTAQLLA